MQLPQSAQIENNHAFEIAKEFLTALLGFLGAIAFDRYKARKKKHSLVVAYLSAIALALDDMCIKFAKHEIPHQSGHTLNALVDEFDPTMAPLVGDALLSLLQQLKALADSAEEVDQGIMMDHEKVETEQWIKDAQRAVGDIRGRIAQLEAGGAIR